MFHAEASSNNWLNGFFSISFVNAKAVCEYVWVYACIILLKGKCGIDSIRRVCVCVENLGT